MPDLFAQSQTIAVITYETSVCNSLGNDDWMDISTLQQVFKPMLQKDMIKWQIIRKKEAIFPTP